MKKLHAAAFGMVFVIGIATPFTLGGHARFRFMAGDSVGESVTVPGQDRTDSGAVGRPERKEAGESAPGGTSMQELRDWLARADESPLLVSRCDDSLRRWVQRLQDADMPAAWQLLARLKSRQLRNKFAAELVDRWAAVDAPAAIKAASEWPDRGERQIMLDRALSGWAAHAPEDALAWIESHYSKPMRNARLRIAMQVCCDAHPESARMLWEQLPPGMVRDATAQSLVWALAREDPQAAITCLDQIQSSHMRRIARNDMLAQWARTDEHGAMEWAQSLPRPADRDESVRAIIAGTMESRPNRAAELLASLPPSSLESNQGFLDEVVGRWVKADQEAARSWIVQLPSGALRERAMASLIPNWTGQDARAAADFVQRLPEGAEQTALLGTVAFSWAARDSKAALNWLETLPEGAALQTVIPGFADGLAARKPEQAAQWVANLPPGNIQAEAAVRVAARWAFADPSSAARWVEAFPSGPTRERAAAMVMNEWSITDREAAEAWSRKIETATKLNVP
jgi:hypothetical protein